jgi:hypothetical protein
MIKKSQGDVIIGGDMVYDVLLHNICNICWYVHTYGKVKRAKLIKGVFGVL